MYPIGPSPCPAFVPPLLYPQINPCSSWPLWALFYPWTLLQQRCNKDSLWNAKWGPGLCPSLCIAPLTRAEIARQECRCACALKGSFQDAPLERLQHSDQHLPQQHKIAWLLVLLILTQLKQVMVWNWFTMLLYNMHNKKQMGDFRKGLKLK